MAGHSVPSRCRPWWGGSGGVPAPSAPPAFPKGWDRQSIFTMQFIIHTGCLGTYGVAFVCQGAGCFMTVTAGIRIGGRLPAPPLSPQRRWRWTRPRGSATQPRGTASSKGQLPPVGERGGCSVLREGVPKGAQTPLAPLSRYWGQPRFGGCSPGMTPPAGAPAPPGRAQQGPCRRGSRVPGGSRGR